MQGITLTEITHADTNTHYTVTIPTTSQQMSSNERNRRIAQENKTFYTYYTRIVIPIEDADW